MQLSLSISVLAALVVASVTPPSLLSLDGAPARRAAEGRVLLFWRADCAPCLLELSDIVALRAAARPLQLTFVGLQPAERLRPALERLKLKRDDSLRTDDGAAALLTRLGGAPPRLPLAVAFRGDGSACGVHTGLIGRDQVRRWAAQCRGRHAPR